jgi:hypothetical protein
MPRGKPLTRSLMPSSKSGVTESEPVGRVRPRRTGPARHPLMDRTGSASAEGHLPGFDRATGWLTSAPLTPADIAATSA